jgi:CubicO group peptidase (beta-lactamase class C family)
MAAGRTMSSCMLMLGVLSGATGAPMLLHPSSPVANASTTTATWDQLRQAIDDFALVGNVAVSVGDGRGELFRHTKGSTTFQTQMGIASATKWVSGVAVMAGEMDAMLPHKQAPS